MVLVDTSVWIRFLTNRMPYAAELDRLLERGEAAAHDLVYGELLIGDSGGRTRLLNSYELILFTGFRLSAMRRSLPSCGHTSCTAQVLDGSMRICSRPPLSRVRLSGRPTSIWPGWPP